MTQQEKNDQHIKNALDNFNVEPGLDAFDKIMQKVPQKKKGFPFFKIIGLGSVLVLFITTAAYFISSKTTTTLSSKTEISPNEAITHTLSPALKKQKEIANKENTTSNATNINTDLNTNKKSELSIPVNSSIKNSVRNSSSSDENSNLTVPKKESTENSFKKAGNTVSLPEKAASGISKTFNNKTQKPNTPNSQNKTLNAGEEVINMNLPKEVASSKKITNPNASTKNGITQPSEKTNNNIRSISKNSVSPINTDHQSPEKTLDEKNNYSTKVINENTNENTALVNLTARSPIFSYTIDTLLKLKSHTAQNNKADSNLINPALHPFVFYAGIYVKPELTTILTRNSNLFQPALVTFNEEKTIAINDYINSRTQKKIHTFNYNAGIKVGVEYNNKWNINISAGLQHFQYTEEKNIYKPKIVYDTTGTSIDTTFFSEDKIKYNSQFNYYTFSIGLNHIIKKGKLNLKPGINVSFNAIKSANTLIINYTNGLTFMENYTNQPIKQSSISADLHFGIETNLSKGISLQLTPGIYYNPFSMFNKNYIFTQKVIGSYAEISLLYYFR